MRKIEKGTLAVLDAWKRANKSKQYRDLTEHDHIKVAIRQACVREQYGLCAYCCRRITADKKSAHNEHVEAQRQAPNRTLDFQNIVASCNYAGRCGDAHKHQPLPLTPLMDECETELRFELSGLVKGLTERARTSIGVLKLGDTREANRGLVYERKQMIELLLFSQGLNPGELASESDELLGLLLEDLLNVDDQQALQAFSPVLVNVIRHQRT
ncbi:TIGR02646 family protein [Pseudomonas lijiangensis]|uniref:TIGR02646 family protein n=1 Tax=Pseudomonas lijiangensis TaxID=2995658 RepID=UPI0031BAA58D